MHAPDNTKEVSEKRARSLRLRVGVPVSTGLCKRRAKPESGPRETGRRSSSEGNSSASQVLRASSSEWNSSASQSRRTHSSEGNNGREANSSASQSRHPSSCPIRPACQRLPRASCAQQVPMCASGPCRDCWSSFSLHPAQHRNYHPSGGSCT